MTLQLANVTFDCDDTLAVSAFWSAALDSPVDPDASEHFASIGTTDTTTPSWFFAKVPEPKTAKNRMHFDLRAQGSVESEVARLVALGATVAHEGPELTVMRDPDGNEFCVE